MKYQWQLFFTALTFFTRLPCARWGLHQEQDLNRAARFFPLVGVVVGAAGGLVFWLAAIWLPLSPALLLSMLATLLLTGAFHEDGLSDAVDGLGGGWEKEQMLAIMKDSRIGSYGAVALVMGLLTKFEALRALPAASIPALLVAGHALSRLVATSLIFSERYVRPDGKAKPLAQHIGRGAFVFALLCGLAPLALLPPRAAWALLPVLLALVWFRRLLRNKLGGYTGDCLGAMQQISEVVFYLGVLACVSH